MIPRTEALNKLRAWQRLHADISKADDAMDALFGCAPESLMQGALWAGFDAYQSEIGSQVGDFAGWLDWFRFECDMGRKPMEAVSVAGRSIKVRTVSQLLTVIRWGAAS